MRNPQSIDLHIEELVLHGFASGDRYAIAAAVERELTQLLTNGSVPSVLVRNLDRVEMDAGLFNIAPGSRAEVIGGQVAHAVYGRLSR
jgi:hypothetical protein